MMPISRILLLLALINSDLIHKEYITTLKSHSYAKATGDLGTNSIFSQG